jgi:hypothetical protein
MKKMPIRCCENCGDYFGCGEDGENSDDCGGFLWSDTATIQMPPKKVYVLMVNPVFEKPIIAGLKIHTIRNNFGFWEKRIKSINRG